MPIGERSCGTLEEKELEHGYFDRHLTIRTEGGDEAAAWLAADERERWLWPGRIPQAGLTLVVGEPRSGKTTFVLDLVARLSREAAWPPEAGPKSKVQSPKSEEAVNTTAVGAYGGAGPKSSVQSPKSEEAGNVLGAYEGSGPKSKVQGPRSGKDAGNPQSAIQNPQSDLSAYGANGGNTAETPIGAQPDRNLQPRTRNLEPDPALGAQPDRNLKPETCNLKPDTPYDKVWRLEPLPPPEPIADGPSPPGTRPMGGRDDGMSSD